MSSPTAVNIFFVAPQRDNVPVLSIVQTSYLISLLSDSYFSSGAEFSRVDVVYMDSSNRQRKTVIHMGPGLQGFVSWSPFAASGTWQKIKVRARDTDGALHFLNRSQIGSGEDITLA